MGVTQQEVGGDASNELGFYNNHPFCWRLGKFPI